MNPHCDFVSTKSDVLRYWLNTRKQKLHHSLRKPTRVKSKAGKFNYRKIANFRSHSMMKSQHPAGMKPAWDHADDRTKLLMAKWRNHMKDVQAWKAKGK